MEPAEDRQSLGDDPKARRNALVNASLEEYPASVAASMTLTSVVRSRNAARSRRMRRRNRAGGSPAVAETNQSSTERDTNNSAARSLPRRPWTYRARERHVTNLAKGHAGLPTPPSCLW